MVDLMLVRRSLATANPVCSWACGDPRRSLCRFARASSRSTNAMARESRRSLTILLPPLRAQPSGLTGSPPST
ncbi:hypothetical protein L484_012601 [Morus notabilis]|uniref:Uncharacterized protein n=1 Tax=Morus notabilis TaxID=981085 RepID=W9QTD8_9ROSA|nr:hypothetical protein L484_012601 [Morus notabilis]